MNETTNATLISTLPSQPVAPPVTIQTPVGIKDWCLARADEWHARGELNFALDFLQHAAAIDHQDATLLNAIGSLQFRLKQFEAALKTFLRTQTLDPENVTLLLQLAVSYQELNRDAEAETHFREALRRDPENCEAARLFTGFLTSRNRLDEAREVVESGLGSDPRDIDLLLRLGVCYYRAANRKAAAACFRRILQLEPINEIARANLAAVEANLNHTR